LAVIGDSPLHPSPPYGWLQQDSFRRAAAGKDRILSALIYRASSPRVLGSEQWIEISLPEPNRCMYGSHNSTIFMSKYSDFQSLLDDIRGHRIPVDFLELFDMARVPFYDGEIIQLGGFEYTYPRSFISKGCMVVELLDYRPQRSKEPPPKTPQKTRVVLHPNSETLWADICSLNQRHGGKWTDKEVIEFEAKLLVRWFLAVRFVGS